jgi:hypothetical protein
LRAGASVEGLNMASLIIIAAIFVIGFSAGFGMRSYMSYRRRH